MSRPVAEVEACGCKWDDTGSPIWMCLQHCPPFDVIIEETPPHPVYIGAESEGEEHAG